LPKSKQQVHDFNPGIDSKGLFWTTAFPRGGVSIDLEDGTARLHANHMAVPDYIDIFNSAGFNKNPIPPIPSFVSFDVRWTAKPGAKLTRITNTEKHFTGKFIDSNATIVWSANTPSTGFTYASESAAKSTTVSGVIGNERNGRFFADSEDD
jgi:hypothetical protein